MTDSDKHLRFNQGLLKDFETQMSGRSGRLRDNGASRQHRGHGNGPALQVTLSRALEGNPSPVPQADHGRPSGLTLEQSPSLVSPFLCLFCSGAPQQTGLRFVPSAAWGPPPAGMAFGPSWLPQDLQGP